MRMSRLRPTRISLVTGLLRKRAQLTIEKRPIRTYNPPSRPRLPVTDVRWGRLEALFHASLPLAAEARVSLLERECADDPALRADVERLLAAHERAGGFIQVPAIALTGPADEPVAGRR